MTTAIAGVPTAVPVFVGYTATAPAAPGAVRLSSLDDYTQAFGGAPNVRFGAVPGTAQDNDFCAGGSFYRLERLSGQFNLYVALWLFFANGGSDCFVVSVGDYSDPVTKQDLLDGLGVAGNTSGPTIVVVPDACLLSAPGDYGDVAVAQLQQCAARGDRVAILDLPGLLDPASWTIGGLAAQRDAFWTAIAPAGSSVMYGMAYAPAVEVSMFDDGDIDEQALQDMPEGTDLDQVRSIVLGKLNIATPGGAMAGHWASSDVNAGVWTAPPKGGPACVIATTVALDDADMQPYKLPPNGYAISILRYIADIGPTNWGVYMLGADGNGNRYIQVRRTLIYIEQSIKQALNQFAFEANDAQTWSAVVAMGDAFLTTLWPGALAGDTAAAAFSVSCGLGSTMTAQDILDGNMIVVVKVALVRPAEYSVFSIVQTMAKS